MSKVRIQSSDGKISPIVIEKSVDAGRVMANIDGKKHEVEILRLRSGRGAFKLEGRIIPFRVVSIGHDVQAWVRNRNHSFQIVGDGEKRRTRQSASAKKELVAPMPGTVLRIHLAKGDAFQPHQPIIIMESMKMELTLSSPGAGTIRELLCSEGELVPLGHVLVRLDFGDGS
ncbi:MAG: biotin/lipoyl-binding protein [Planctomycetes bacterium]|nr:biotin/lipoyl-binding protein [Planctomycetota bacterium]MBI3835624.1 biotin/lipoyl-binding protein [Planctomycetota bacterium]